MGGQMFEYKKRLATRPGATPGILRTFFNLTHHDRTLALPVLYHHLRVDSIDPPAPHIVLAQLSLRLLSTCILDAPGLISDVEEHWDLIWAWSSFLLRRRIDDKASALDDAVLGYNTDHHHTMFLLSALAKLPLMRARALESGSDVLPLFVHIWKHETNVTDVQCKFISAAAVIKNILGPKIHCCRLPQALGESALGDFTQVCLARMRSALTHTNSKDALSCRVGPILDDLFILTSCSSIPPIHNVFLAKGSVALVLRFMRQLSTRIGDISVRDAGKDRQTLFLTLATRYLQQCCELDGLACILQVLEGRLLVILFKLAYHLRSLPSATESECSSLCKMLAPYLIHRSVLLHVRKSLKTIAALDVLRGSGCVDKPEVVIRTIYGSLCVSVDVWTKIKLRIDAARYTDGCQNPMHRSGTGDSDSVNGNVYKALKRCGGCEYAYYCSPECRKEDWEWHSGECVQIAANRHAKSPEPEALSERDRSLLYHAAVTDNTVVRQKWVELKSTDFAATPGVNTVVKLDYTVVPMVVSTVPVEAFEWRDWGIDEGVWVCALERVDAGPPGLTLVCAIIPSGEEPYKVVTVEDVGFTFSADIPFEFGFSAGKGQGS